MPSLYDNQFQQNMLNPWANQANQPYQPYQANPYAQAFNPYQANQAAMPYGMAGYQPYTAMNYQPGAPPQTQRASLTANPNLFRQSLYGLTGGMGDYTPGGGQPGYWEPPGGYGGFGSLMQSGAPPPPTTGDNRYGLQPFPKKWDYEYPGLPLGTPPSQVVGGVGGRYVLPIPGFTPAQGGNPATGIGDVGFRWPWEGQGMWSDPDLAKQEAYQGWANWMLNAIGQQRGATEWNQQFNANQRMNDINMSMDISKLIWDQQQQAAQFGEGQYQFDTTTGMQQRQFDVTAGMQQQDRDLAQQMQDFNEQAQTGYVKDARTGQYVPAQQMRQQIDAMFLARGTAPVQNPDGSYVMTRANPGDSNSPLVPMMANTLEQNKYIADMFGGRMVNGKWQETLPMNQFIQQTAGQTGFTPTWDPDKNDWTRWSSNGVGGDGTPHRAGDIIMQTTEAHSERIAQQFGYRFNPQTGQRELTQPAQQQLQNVWASRGLAPVMNERGEYVYGTDGNVLMAPTEAKSQRVADQFGYRWTTVKDAQGNDVIDPATGKPKQVMEETLEAQYQDIIRARERASQTGNFTDPVTGQTQDTLAKQQQQFEQMMATSGVTGQFAGQDTVQEEQRQWQNYFAQLQQSQTQANLGGYYTTAGGVQAPTLERQAQEAALTGKYGTAKTVQEQQREWQNWQADLARREQLGLSQAGLTGMYDNKQTQQAQQQAWQQGFQTQEQMMNALGTYNGQDTLAKQQQDWQQQFQNRGQQSDILSQTGYVYDPYTNAKTQTLAGQQQGWGQGFQQAEANRQFGLDVGGLTGMYQGQQTLAGQQAARDWQAQQANITGYWPGAGDTGGDYTPGGGQPTNPWDRGSPTMAMQNQLWQQQTQFPQMQATERRGQNYGVYGRATPRNNRWA